ncbi:hypothetical protein DID77_00230 [Candidatus Marinamargulisbacteria bacterium SCGC AG-439-L15]|nr:hypothetical protein DID77_00230 [Candidatus Marinamargulisbacteria bacterium SCGC AG-439-L15]
MDIRPQKPNSGNLKGKKDIAADAASIILGVDNQDIKIESTRIHALCAKFAEIAESLGETNNPDRYAEKMEATITEAYQNVANKQKKKRQNR